MLKSHGGTHLIMKTEREGIQEGLIDSALQEQTRIHGLSYDVNPVIGCGAEDEGENHFA